MCVLGNQILVVWLPFFYFCPVFVGSLREGTMWTLWTKKSAPILTDWCTHSNIRQKNKKIIY